VRGEVGVGLFDGVGVLRLKFASDGPDTPHKRGPGVPHERDWRYSTFPR